MPFRPLVFVVSTHFCALVGLSGAESCGSMNPRADATCPEQLKVFFSQGEVWYFGLRHTHVNRHRHRSGGSRTKVWAIHQPGSLGDVKSLSFICMKVCELSFVDIGVHRTRLIAISVLRWVRSTEIVFINHAQVRSLLVILIAFQAWEVIF